MEKVFASVRLPLDFQFTVARTSQSPFPLPAIITDDITLTNNNKI